MLFKIGNSGRNIRFFQKVDTVDDQYDIRDIGIEHADGGIDSLVVGGSFYSLKKVIAEADEDARLSYQANLATAQCVTRPAVGSVDTQPVVNRAGETVEVEGL